MMVTYIVERDLYVKIGRTRHPRERLRCLARSKTPGVIIPHNMTWSMPLTVIAVLAGDIEAWLHQRFAHQRVVGEWFIADADMLRCLNRLPAREPDARKRLDELAHHWETADFPAMTP